MAFFDCHFFSDVLGLTVSAHVVVPQAASQQIGLAGGQSRGSYATLYLLHGLSDDHTIWTRRTSIERYAAAKNLAVIMPAVGRSFYQDMASGPRYWTFLAEELPAVMRGFFPLSAAREETFAAGLSMGGYGALRLALAMPDRYGAAASLSGALDVVRACRNAGRPGSRMSGAEIAGIFGPAPDPAGSDADLWSLARRLEPATAPELFLACGTEDTLLAENRAFHKHLQGLGLDHAYAESPGAHEWGYWDAQIQRVIEWLPLVG